MGIISYQEESWSEFYPEFLPLWKTEHRIEVAEPEYTEKGNFNSELYEILEAQNALHIVSVRDDWNLVGYIVSMLSRHPHFDTVLCATPTLYFLSHKYRGQSVGSTMFRYAEAWLKDRKVNLFVIEAKSNLPYKVIFEHLGFRAVSNILIKEISGA